MCQIIVNVMTHANFQVSGQLPPVRFRVRVRVRVSFRVGGQFSPGVIVLEPNFQHYRAYLARVIWENRLLTANICKHCSSTSYTSNYM